MALSYHGQMMLRNGVGQGPVPATIFAPKEPTARTKHALANPVMRWGINKNNPNVSHKASDIRIFLGGQFSARADS